MPLYYFSCFQCYHHEEQSCSGPVYCPECGRRMIADKEDEFFGMTEEEEDEPKQER